MICLCACCKAQQTHQDKQPPVHGYAFGKTKQLLLEQLLEQAATSSAASLSQKAQALPLQCGVGVQTMHALHVTVMLVTVATCSSA